MLWIWAALALAQAPPQARDLARDGTFFRQPVAMPRGYALVIGISDYKNLEGKEDLRFAERDAEALHDILLSPQGGNLDFQNIRKLTGREATLANIRAAVEEWIPSTLTPDDRLVVFFGGHAMTGPDRRTYLAPWDVEKGRIAETGYPVDRLGEVLANKAKARWKVLLLDACHSGDISAPQAVQDGVAKMPDDFLILTSSRGAEQSFEDPRLAGGRGVFAYFLEQAWRGQADASPGDGFVVAAEMIQYVQREVAAYATKNGVEQHPGERGRYDNGMILGFDAARRAKLGAETPELAFGTLIVSVSRPDVRILIDGKPVGESSPGKELRLPGLAPGEHTLQAVRKGYDPVEVKVNVVPGLVKLIEIPLNYSRRIKASSDSLRKQANELWEKGRSGGDYRKAAELFARALKEDDRNSDAALGLCRVLQALDDEKKALEACKRAVAIDPEFAEARTHLALLHLESGDSNEAVRDLRRAAESDPGNALIQSNLAMAYLDVARFPEAEKAATRAIEMAGAQSNVAGQAYTTRGEARRAQERFAEAAADYQQALKVQSFDSGLLRLVYYWGFSFAPGLTTKTRSGVRSLYREQKATALAGLCAAELGRARPKQALEYCRQAIGADKTDENLYSLTAEVYRSMFKQENRQDYLAQSIEASEKALRINPDMDKAKLLHGSIEEMRAILREMKAAR